ncbi:hypothetical protein S40293_02046 [Stachybotrys chartarum IBT 40293]|nr:hypothetical protein S40293_02046 [Stachybotrys chartarum IBT 40293]
MASSRAQRTSWLWRDDVELAKKDDDLDLHATRHLRHGNQWSAARAPRRSVVTRTVLYAFVVFVVFLTLYNILGTSFEPPTVSIYSTDPLYAGSDDPRLQKARTGSRGHAAPYSGQIRFPDLAASIQAINEMAGLGFRNRNIIFATASLGSASSLLPLACKMAAEGQNYVHFALMSRSNIPMKQLLEINGINADDCKVTLHDARPNRAVDSSETRMALASARALYHLNSYLHPQAIVVDGTSAEEKYFLLGIRDQIRATQAALIELPRAPEDRLPWITKLDSMALAAWDKVHFDILIHAPVAGTGSLNRLLRSLSRADLGSVAVPHLTIELPAQIPSFTSKLLETFQWPPAHMDHSGQKSMLQLRHRISRKTADEEESSVRFLESFWPRKPAHHHVLVLSPDTELSPEFFHYLKYSLLQYRYSRGAMELGHNMRLMGLSFSTPTTQLDLKQPLVPPKPTEKDATMSRGAPFLWQAPSSDAVLFMGDKWVELHGYISQMMERQRVLDTTPAFMAVKQVSKKYPAWLEYVLQLARIRGYYTLYPSRETADTIIGVHNDLHEAPEEYSEDQPKEGEAGEPITGDPAVLDPGPYVDILATLPREGPWPSLRDLPVLTWKGEAVAHEELEERAVEFSKEFRRDVGQCNEEALSTFSTDEYARDLFCDAKANAKADTKPDAKVDA